MSQPKSDLCVAIGQRLKEERKRLGVDQIECAIKAGLCKNSISGYEVGDRPPTAEFLLTLHHMGGDVLYVLTGERSTPATVDSANEIEQAPNPIWYPDVDQPFLITSPSQVTDALCQILFVCLDISSETHILARPVLVGTTAIIAPVILPRDRYRFSPGDSAAISLGLKDEVAKVVKLRHAQLTKPLDA
ncbi:MAG: helix-turn-helix transcriptional regulator [Pseudohongiella sp.]|nr:helix-turn-helix transcriptional regulator [Pseudohongiella sp.]MDP2091963.1 helix-turn-helix transcriptional regulator [Pseudohongiella sp.]